MQGMKLLTIISNALYIWWMIFESVIRFFKTMCKACTLCTSTLYMITKCAILCNNQLLRWHDVIFIMRKKLRANKISWLLQYLPMNTLGVQMWSANQISPSRFCKCINILFKLYSSNYKVNKTKFLGLWEEYFKMHFEQMSSNIICIHCSRVGQWAYVLFKRTQHSCVLLHSLWKNVSFFAFFYILYQRMFRSLHSFTFFIKECGVLCVFLGSL